MCHCGDPRFPVPNNFRVCAANDVYQRNCLKRAAVALGNVNKVSGCQCPKPCQVPAILFDASSIGSQN